MQSERGAERREFQRLELESPISAMFGQTRVWIAEIGVLGARVRHTEPMEKPRADLRFLSDGKELILRCETVRTITRPSWTESGLRFLAAVGDSGDRLRTMLAEIVTKALANRQSPDLAAAFDSSSIDGDRTVRGVAAQFVCYRLEDGSWNRRRAFLPEQPPTGFTVAAGEDQDEIRRLCDVYSASDEEGRRLIRLFAELSVSQLLQIPPAAPIQAQGL
jgi:hypothetical protein